MRCCIYARESSADTNKAPPIAEQIARAKQYIIEQGYELINIYQDNGFSGGDWKRPAWNQLVNDSKRHLFKIVITWSQDRLARDTEQFLWFYRNLKKSYVQIHSLTDGAINMESVGDRVKHTSLAQASEIFRLITSEKVKQTYAAAKSKAEREGKKVKWGREPKELDVKTIIALRRSGKGYRAISKEIGDISYQTIRRALLKYHSENPNVSEENSSDNEGVTT